MKKLLEGYGRFRAQHWLENRELFETLAEQGQKPKALVISCVDSRVDPAVIFDATHGEILTVRNVANLVPPYAPDVAYHGTSAALEFGVQVLGIPHVIVLGHSQCGGIRALLAGSAEGAHDFIEPWMSIAREARYKALTCTTPDAQQLCCEHEAIKVSLQNLMGFPWIAERVRAGNLQLHGAWFSISTGELQMMQPGGDFTAAEKIRV